MGITTINGKNHVLLIDSGIPTEPKLRTPVNYALRVLFASNYLEFPLLKEHRSFLTKIRISAYSLNIETGRYNSTPHKQCLCKFCTSSVEDEKHFYITLH
jgi:hypothetical protein